LLDPEPRSNTKNIQRRLSCGYFFTLLVVMIFLSPCPAAGNENEALLTFSGDLLSADLREFPLMTVLNKIKQEKGLWLKGEEKVGDASISLSFHDLPLTAALERMLTRFNYSFIYDLGNRLVGVFIVGKSGNSSSVRPRPGPFRPPIGPRRSPISK
jgi:hypothetical protein